MAQTTAIAVTEKTVGQYVQDTLPALIKSYAVRDYNGPAWMKTAALCIVENPDLMACLQTDAGRISLKHALRFAATTGLSLNPQEGMACLVAIQGKVNYWPMKNGLVQLVLDTGAVSRVRMNAVHKNDGWKIEETMDGTNYHWAPARTNRGEIDLFFAAAKLTDGTTVVEVMTREEVEEHKKKYGKGITSSGSAWNTSFEGMGIKTVTKRLCTRLKLAPENAKVLQAALAEGEAEPVEFTHGPADKGASATDVEAKLAKVTAEVVTSGGAVQQVQVEEQQATAQASATPPSAQGSTPEADKGDGQIDIF